MTWLQNRINALTSEVHRLRAKLAADAGNVELVNEIAASASAAEEPADNTSAPLPEEALVHSLKKQLAEAEVLISTFRERLQTLGEGAVKEDLDMATQLVESEAKAQSDLKATQEKLQRLEALLGSDSDNADLTALTKRCESAEGIVKKLEANLKLQEISTGMLISEVTRLSEAWQQLDTQNQSNVFEMSQYEDKIQTHLLHKSKAQNRYYSCERDKQALNSQLEAYKRAIASSKQVIDAAKEEKLKLSHRCDRAEQEVIQQEERLKVYEEQTAKLEGIAKASEIKESSTYKQFVEVGSFRFPPKM